MDTAGQEAVAWRHGVGHRDRQAVADRAIRPYAEPPAREIRAIRSVEIRGRRLPKSPMLRLSYPADLRRWTTRFQPPILESRRRGISRGFVISHLLRTRSIKSLSEDVRVNHALWTLTAKMAELV